MTAKRKDKETTPLTNPAGEVRELKSEDFAKFQPADEVIPGIAEGMKRLRGQRGKQKAPTKVQKTKPPPLSPLSGLGIKVNIATD